MAKVEEGQGIVSASCEDSACVLRLEGDFDLRRGCAECREALESVLTPETRVLRYDTAALGGWDSSLVALLLHIERHAAALGIETDRAELPANMRSLLEMALVRAADITKPPAPEPGWLEQLGDAAELAWREFLAFLDFTGAVTLGLRRLATGKARMRWRDFWYILQSVSVNALPIVLLISFLVGLIIAFLGAVILARFGAEFAIAYLVGYGILREMGAIMTGVIMAGRTGAAFAAQIGSMKVSEEIDALKTLGISEIDFLVLPRVITLVLMMPVLTIFADVIGIFGGYLVANLMMDVPPNQFFLNVDFVAGPKDFLLGVFKGGVFGVLVAISGCMRGLQSGHSADAVGVAATRAVVLAITLIVLSNAIIDWAAAHFGV